MRFRIKDRRRTSHTGTPGQAGFSEASSSKKGRWLGILFGFVFFAMGALFCWMGAIKPILGVIDSRSWPQVPCRIASSEVERIHGSDSVTYKVAITFSYRFEGRDYTGGSYDFSDASSSGRKGKAEIVGRYPVGHETLCWVNPRDPTVAVLSRSIPGMVYFVIPFTSVFMLIGGAIMLGSAGLLPKKWTASFQKTRHQRVEQADRGEFQLEPSSGPVAKLVGAIFFAAFWNGIVSVFVWAAFDSFRKGDPEWFLVVFLVPFVLIGIGCLALIPYFALALSNPKLHLSLDEGSPRLGGTVRLRWHLSGSIHRLKDLAFTLEGREAATYQRGTRSVTDTSLFCREMIFETDEPSAHRNGEVRFTVPADLMHSFSGGNNKIEWSLHVRGSIPRWPDVKESYPIVIRPLLPSQS